MNPNNLKKSLLNYAIEGNLSFKFRRENPSLNAFEEIETYNQKIKHLKSQREQWKNNLEKLSKQTKEDSKKQRIKHILTRLKKRISSYQAITPINADEEPPFEIPETWAWVRLKSICDIVLGKTPKTDNPKYWGLQGIPWVSIGDMKNQQVISYTKKTITQQAKQEIFSNQIIPKGTLLLSFKLTIGTTSIMGFDGFHNEAIASIIPKINTKTMKTFFLKFLGHLTSNAETVSAIKGNTLNKQTLSKLAIPLPPLEEQKFIVNEIERLLSHTQDFESKAQQLQDLENTLSSFIDKSLLNYAIEGNLSFKFRRENPSLNAFEEIETYNQKIKRLKSQREQWKNNLEKLSKQIKEDSKKQRIKHILTRLKKRISSYQAITPINADEEVPFEIPETWAWVRLGEVGLTSTGSTPNTSDLNNYGNYIDFLSPANISEDGRLLFVDKQLSKKGASKTRIFPTNAILVTCIGGSIGKSYLSTKNITCNQQFNIIYRYFFYPYALFYFIQSNFFQTLIRHTSTGTATPILNKTLFEKLPIPLPPLEEQKFISSEIERLLDLCLKIKETA